MNWQVKDGVLISDNHCLTRLDASRDGLCSKYCTEDRYTVWKIVHGLHTASASNTILAVSFLVLFAG